MKRLVINVILLSIAVGIGVGLFFMKQRVVEYEKELTRLTDSILADRREIHTLKADWAVLTEPSRLRRLLTESEVKQIDTKQIVLPEAVALQPIPVPPKKPFAQENDVEEVTDETI